MIELLARIITGIHLDCIGNPARQITISPIEIALHLKHFKWRPPSQSGLTPYHISSGLTHLGSEASKYHISVLFIVCLYNR